MTTARYLIGDVFDGLATLEDGSVDLVVTSPPFIALRSYLPADHPDKHREIGSEATPAEFIDVMLAVTAELRRVLAPHGSIAIELGDTYAGSGGAGGDYQETGLRGGQAHYDGSASGARRAARKGYGGAADRLDAPIPTKGEGWPLAKSKTLIPELYRLALAYGINPLTGQESPAGKWRVRNVVTWCRPNPPVGALGDKWRPATSDVVIACTSEKRYWDDIATRRPAQGQPDAPSNGPKAKEREKAGIDGAGRYAARIDSNVAGAPLLDWWKITTGGYKGAHYATFPTELVEPLVKAMAPPKVCDTCGEPSRRIVEQTEEYAAFRAKVASGDKHPSAYDDVPGRGVSGLVGTAKAKGDAPARAAHKWNTLGWSDCGHDDWRIGVVLDPFAGTGTTLAVATGHGHDAIGIDLDSRNYQLALERVGPLVLQPSTPV